jgi:hypothetical protein
MNKGSPLWTEYLALRFEKTIGPLGNDVNRR